MSRCVELIMETSTATSKQQIIPHSLSKSCSSGQISSTGSQRRKKYFMFSSCVSGSDECTDSSSSPLPVENTSGLMVSDCKITKNISTRATIASVCKKTISTRSINKVNSTSSSSLPNAVCSERKCATLPLSMTADYSQFNNKNFNDIENSPENDTSYEKAVSGDNSRRGSVPESLGWSPRLNNMDNPNTPSRIAHFFSKRSFKSNPLKRTKSVTKLERKRCSPETDSLPPTPLRTSHSHESLLSSQKVLHTFDLSGEDIQVKPLHSSMIGQDHCFQVTSNSGTKYFACKTADDRERWLNSLRRTIQPNQDNLRRTDNSLQIWILEAKGIASKKKYFCELCLDKTLYARTSSKLKQELCFWGETFEFNELPSVNMITVNLYREPDKKKRKDKNLLIGSVTIPTDVVKARHFTEKWYTVKTERSGGSKEFPTIRIKSRYQTVNILPLELYSDFLGFVKENYKLLCEVIEPVVSVKAKEDIATSLVHIMQKEGIAKDFLADIVIADVDKIDNEHLTFRGNSLATKATEAYMKLVGEKFLQDTLGDVIQQILQSTDDCEVDPQRITNNSLLQKQQNLLMSIVELTWSRIINSHSCFPTELREVFHSYRKRLSSAAKEEFCDNLISASIFLRFLCPAILSPSLFNLAQEFPCEKAARKLTLVAKTIQTLANFTKFGGKENFMDFMNGFIEREWVTMKKFLHEISSLRSDDLFLDYDGYIDLGKELSILQMLLSEFLPKVQNKEHQDFIDRLQTKVDGITVVMTQPGVMRQMSSNAALDNACTSPSLSTTKCASVCSPGVQSLQRSLPRPQTASLHSVNDTRSSPTDTCNGPSSDNGGTPKASTLPRNVILLGSGREAAPDLSTSDDYVLFSALDYPESFVNARARRSEGKQPKNVDEQHTYCDMIRYADDVVDDAANDDLRNDTKGSQLSISQLSAIASSGYQSHTAHSQSSSPIDHVTGSTNVIDSGHGTSTMSSTTSQHSQSSPGLPRTPLAFKNPMYHHYPTDVASKNTKRSGIVEKTANASNIDDIIVVTPPSICFPQESTGPNRSSIKQSVHNGNQSSTHDHNYHKKCISSSSSSLDSSDNSPCHRDRSVYVSVAPRTNPRYSNQSKSRTNTPSCRQTNAGSSTIDHVCHVGCVHQLPYKDGSQSVPIGGRRKHKFGTKKSDTHEILKKSESLDGWGSDSSSSLNQSLSPIRRSPHKTKHHNRSKTNLADDKSFHEYEIEIQNLRRTMHELQMKLNDAEVSLSKRDSSSTTNRNRKNSTDSLDDQRIKKQQVEKDEQMKNIITRLITVEEELRKEKSEMQEVITEKQRMIETRDRQIRSLDTANSRLLSALGSINECFQQKNASNKDIVASLSEIGELKSSSC